jgi:hypothetical protein
MSSERAREHDLFVVGQSDEGTSDGLAASQQDQGAASSGWYIIGPERGRRCPKEYQDHVNAIGGMNRYGEPNFKITWLQGPADLVYGIDANGKKGQHIIAKYGDVPAWGIEVWKPPECYGTPELWYALTWDWEADAPTIGDYPHRGLYEPAPFNLFVRKVENGVMTFDAMPLTHWLIDLLIPNLLKEQETTYAQRKVAIQNRMLAERQRANQLALDAYLDAGVAFGNRAGTHESNRERWMQRVQEKQQGMKISRDEIVARMGLGHRQRRSQ